MTASGNEPKLYDYRPLKTTEYVILQSDMKNFVAIALIGDIILLSIAIGFGIAPGYPVRAKIISIILIIFLTIIFTAIIFWDWKKMKNDSDSGNARYIRGNVTHKWIGLKGVGSYVVVDHRVFDIPYTDWHTINIGDEIIIEWAPLSRIIFNVKKLKANPSIMRSSK